MVFSENIAILTISRHMSRLSSNRVNVTFVIEPHQAPELFAVSGVAIFSLGTIARHSVETSKQMFPDSRNLNNGGVSLLCHHDSLAQCTGSGDEMMLDDVLNRRAEEAGLSKRAPGKFSARSLQGWHASLTTFPSPLFHHHVPIITDFMDDLHDIRLSTSSL
jgi:hypothetical protein